MLPNPGVLLQKPCLSFTEIDVFSALCAGKHPVKAPHSFVATGQFPSKMIKMSVRNKPELLMEQEDKLPLKTASLIEHQNFCISRATKKENTKTFSFFFYF